MDRHQKAFIDEAQELLAELEQSLLALEHDPRNGDHVSRAFRALHTIKGAGAMFGFEAIAEFTHLFESVFDRVREGTLEMTPGLTTVALAGRDHLALLVQIAGAGEQPDERVLGSGEAIVNTLRTLTGSGTGTVQPQSREAAALPSSSAGTRTFSIRFRPPENIYLRGLDPEALVAEVCALGKSKVTVMMPAEVPAGEDRVCHTTWDIVLETSAEKNTVRDVFIFVEEDSELLIEETAPVIASTSAAPGNAGSGGAAARPPEKTAAHSIKVPAERLDKLVNLVGELVTAQALLNQVARTNAVPGIVQIAERVDTLVGELRDTSMSLRMVPIGSMFLRFQRLVRDLSRDLGKDIRLITRGEETEVDKTVFEKLGDPLVHMIRNSIDHGIEPPGERRAAGKDPAGTVRLEAGHSGAHIYLTIEDDGRGLNRAAIHAKAVERGLLKPDAEPTEAEVFSLIFAPGFSTAREVTSVSGRGVGMDVVRRAIDDLGGSIDVRSVVGMGTTIRLKIPLTLAIIDGLLVTVAGEPFVLPLAMVQECVELPQVASGEEQVTGLLRVREDQIPYIRLRRFFGSADAGRRPEYAVVASVGSLRVGFVVDGVVGQHQTVVKPLGPMYRKCRGVSGATILGDGNVALIADPHLILESVVAAEHAGAERAAAGTRSSV